MDNLEGTYYNNAFEPDRPPKMPPVPTRIQPLPKIPGDYEHNGSNFWGGFFMGLLVIGVLTLGTFLVYYVAEGRFQDNIDQDVLVEPQINVTVANDYEFKPTTTNTYNHDVNPTIIVQNLHVHTNST